MSIKSCRHILELTLNKIINLKMRIMSALKVPFGTIGKSPETPYRGVLQAQSVQKHNLATSPWK